MTNNENDSLLDQTWFNETENEDNATREMDTSTIDVHEQFLEKLSQERNGQINNALIFYLPSKPDPIVFVDETEINVGRRDRKGRIVPELDLGDYPSSEFGISRLHAKIIFDGEKYMIQDLHSTNHSWLNGQKLVPYHYYPLMDGSTLQFAKLATTVFIIKR